MERLTHFIAFINGKKEYRAENYQGAPGGNKKDFINALGPYEDTGLTPDELAEAAELLKAKREGRCVVLPSKDYTFTVRGDIAISIIKANCDAATRAEAEASLAKENRPN